MQRTQKNHIGKGMLAFLLALSMTVQPMAATAFAAANTAASSTKATAGSTLSAKETVTLRYKKAYKGVTKNDTVQLFTVSTKDGLADGSAIAVTPDKPLITDNTKATGKRVTTDAVALAQAAYYAYGAPGWTKAKKLYSAGVEAINAGLAKSHRIGYVWLSAKVQAYAYMRYSTARGLGLASSNGWGQGLTKRQKSVVTGLYADIRKLKKAPSGFGVYAVRGGKKADLLYWRALKVIEISMPAPGLTINVGETKTIQADVVPKNALNTAMTWKSSNEKVATVTSQGTIKGIAAGTATITATAKDGSGKKASCKVTVSKVVETGSFYIELLCDQDHIDGCPFAGSEFTIYRSRSGNLECSGVVAKLTVGRDGRTPNVQLEPGTYYVKETMPAKEYKLSNEVITIIIKAEQDNVLRKRAAHMSLVS